MSFIYYPDRGQTPQSVARMRLLAAQMMRQMQASRAPQTVGEGIGQGLSAIGDGIVANVLNRRADRAEREGKEASNALYGNIVSGFGVDQTGGFPMTGGAGEVSATSPGGGNYRDAIASIESAGSGDYAAIGPRHPKMGRAMGRYQIMESNIGPWSKEALGREITPEEFMANPKLQDAIFDHQFGQYVNQYGPEGAAQAWFGGPGGVGKTGRRDVLGTSVGGYGQRFMSAIGGGDVASADPQQAFRAVMPELGNGPSLSDEVAEYQQTPEYRARFPGMAEQPFDSGRFGDEIPVQPVQGRESLATALAANDPATSGQQAIDAQTSGIPDQFRGSQQLMNAQGGIVPALMEGAPATGQQIADAYARGNRPAQNETPIDLLLRAAGDPYLMDDPGKAAVVKMLLEQEMQKRDPSRQLDMDYKRAQIDAMNRKAQGIDDPAKVQSSVVLDDGTTVMVMNDGTRKVLAPDGSVMTGLDAAKAIRAARDYTVQNQQDIYTARRSGTLGADITLGGQAEGVKEAGKETIKAGMEAWAGYGKLQTNLGNIDEAISALDKGAQSGLVYSMLPSVTEASASLENAMNRMGLDVIGSVTFGALSEGEMRLAMDTAVPRNLGPQELRSWLVRKRAAQEKAAGMLADAAQYLTKPGNTINGWIERNRAQKPDGADSGNGANALAAARDAIAKGAKREDVIKRLRENGIDPGGL